MKELKLKNFEELLIQRSEDYSKSCQISNMQLFAKIMNIYTYNLKPNDKNVTGRNPSYVLGLQIHQNITFLTFSEDSS